jgi:hypothetical protein
VSTPVVICQASGFPIRRIMRCPTCKKRRRFSGRAYVWYGPTVTCCGCGDSWSDGERNDRPFRRNWRASAIAAAKELWAEAGRYTKEDQDRWFKEQAGYVEPVAVAGGVL